MDLILKKLESKETSRKREARKLIFLCRDYLEEHVPYIAMRVFCGIAGLLVVPIAYLTIRNTGHSIAAGLVAAFMVCYGTSL